MTSTPASIGLPPLLALIPPEARQRRAALVVTLIASVLFLAAAPFARVQLPALAAFLPIYQSAYVVISLITAVLLLGQLRILRLRSLLLLAGAFLFDAFMATAHALSFPALFAPTGLLGAREQTTAWLYFLWHGGFPLLVAGYALLKGRAADALPPGLRAGTANGLCVGVAFAFAAGLTLLATAGHDLLPPIMRGDLDAPNKIVAATLTWLLSITALVLLWRRRPHSLLDLWLMVVVAIWIFDSALAAVLNHGRYDVGWYAGRVCGLVAGSLVLVMLLLEANQLYLQLARLRTQEQRQSSARLQESEARFGRLFNDAPLPLCFVDKNGVLVDRNLRFDRTFGYSHAELRTLGDWWPLAYPDPAYRAQVLATWNAALEEAAGSGADIAPIEYTIVCKDGSRRVMLVSGIVLGEDFLATFFDITERKQAELELRRRNAELESFDRAAVGRELEMIRLKRQVNELARELGRDAPYDLSFAAGMEPGAREKIS